MHNRHDPTHTNAVQLVRRAPAFSKRPTLLHSRCHVLPHQHAHAVQQLVGADAMCPAHPRCCCCCRQPLSQRAQRGAVQLHQSRALPEGSHGRRAEAAAQLQGRLGRQVVEKVLQTEKEQAGREGVRCLTGSC